LLETDITFGTENLRRSEYTNGESLHSRVSSWTFPFRVSNNFLFASLLCIVAISNVGWLMSIPYGIIGVDADIYHAASMHILRYLTGIQEWGFEPSIYPGSYRGPLFFLASVALPYLLGAKHMLFALTNTFFLIVLLSAVYGIGRRLFSERQGLIAAVICVSIPAVLLGSRSFNLEIALSSMIALSMYCLVRSAQLTKLGWALCFGAAGALAMLAKGTAFVFFLAPLGGIWLSIIGRGVKSLRGADRSNFIRSFLYSALAIGVFILISSLWYKNLFTHLFVSIGNHLEVYNNTPDAYNTLKEGQSSFPAQILKGIGPFTLALMLLAVISFLRKKPRGFFILIPWAVLPVLAFASAPADLVRFLQPSYPAFALICGRFFSESLNKRKIIQILLAVGMALQMVFTSIPPTFAKPITSFQRPCFTWEERSDFISAVKRSTQGENPTVVIYQPQLVYELGINVVYYFLSLGMPQAKIHITTSQDSLANYRLRTFCENMPEADIVVLIGNRTLMEEIKTGSFISHHPGLANQNQGENENSTTSCLKKLRKRVTNIEPLARFANHGSVILLYPGRQEPSDLNGENVDNDQLN